MEVSYKLKENSIEPMCKDWRWQLSTHYSYKSRNKKVKVVGSVLCSKRKWNSSIFSQPLCQFWITLKGQTAFLVLHISLLNKYHPRSLSLCFFHIELLKERKNLVYVFPKNNVKHNQFLIARYTSDVSFTFTSTKT